MIGMTLVTHQTGPEGKKVGRVLIEEGLQIDRELYLSIVIDRAQRVARSSSPARPAAWTSRRWRRRTRSRSSARSSTAGTGIMPFQAPQARRSAWGSTAPAANKLAKVLASLYEAFIETDASMIEINPLIVTKGGDLLALDAKVTFDDNALYRHPDLRDLRDLDRRRPARGRGVEVLAQLHPPRRQHRLHGQRRRPGHGDDGHHQAGRAASRPTSSTSAAAPTPSRSATRSRS